MQGKETGRSRLALVTIGGRDSAAEAAAARSPAGGTVPSPFSAAVPDRYFETPALRDCHARIARAALDSDTVAVVEGEHGCGKSTFVRILQQRMGTSRDLCFIDVRIPQGERYVLDCLRRTFCPGQAADAQTLVAQLVERGQHGNGCLIVVDDADKLSVFALRWLFELKRTAAETGSRLGVIITMSPLRLDAALALPSFASYRKRGLTRVELPHLTAQETADYLRARIESAGLAAAISFDEAQVQRIHQASGGLPQHIKRVAGELLEGTKPKPFRKALRQQRRTRFRQTLIPVALVAVPLVIIVLLLQAIYHRPADDAVVERLMSTTGIEAAGTTVPLAPVASGTVDRAPEAHATRLDKTPGTTTAKLAVPAQATTPTPPVNQPVPVAAPVVAAAPRPAAQEPPRITLPASDTTRQETITAAATGTVVNPESESESEPEARPDSGSESIPAAAAPVQVIKPEPVHTAALDGNAWLRAQNPAFFTLQLAGSEERRDVEQFIDKYALPGKVVVVDVLRNGKVWYMVLYNSYPTWGDARRELGMLPTQIHRNNPFARRFASVQAIAVAP
jgi:septal ring-binding cell division protein DamX/type II secretory pathway predicted ATPase ExeA